MTNPLDIAQWANHWEALARQAGEHLAGSTSQAPWHGSAPSAPPWAGLFDASGAVPGTGRQNEAIERLLAGAQGYLAMLQSMATAAAGQGVGADGGFAEAMRQGVFPGAFSNSAMGNPLASAMRGFSGKGAQGLDQMMERFAAMAGPLFDAVKGGLKAPAFGHLREKQENLQNAARLMIDYQEQSARYDRLMLKVSEQSFARFQLKLAEREEPGRQIDSVRALYDLWIDAAEEAYAEIALSEEFREVYAGVVDAQMRLRKHVQGEVEKLCAEFGMPTRSEVDSIGQRLQALRREFREEREPGAGRDDIAAELDALRSEVDRLKAASSAPAGKTKVQAAGRPVKKRAAKTAGKSARPAAPAEAAHAEKAVHAARTATSAAAAKKSRSRKATPAARAARGGEVSVTAGTDSPKPAGRAGSGSRKTKRKAASKPASKAAPARRAKRRKSSAGKVGAVAAKSAGGKGGAEPGSFAASIARFARKSRSASASTLRARGSQKISKRGGGK